MLVYPQFLAMRHKMTFEYKSPKHKLLKFFEESRNKWKDRAKNAKADIKNLNCKLRYHQEKNVKLKNEVKELKCQILSQPATTVQEKKVFNNH